MEFDNYPKRMPKRLLKQRINPFDSFFKISQFKIALNQEIYNNLHKSIKCADLSKVENIENFIEYETTKFEQLGKDFYNEQERATIRDKEDLKNYIIRRSKVFYEMRDFNVSSSINDQTIDVLNFKIFCRNPFLDKIKKIVNKFIHQYYPDIETSDQIYYYKLSKPIDFKNVYNSSDSFYDVK